MNDNTKVLVQMSGSSYEELQDHLLPDDMAAEEAAFLFARATYGGDRLEFHVVDWYPVPHEGFVTRSLHFLELTNETRALVIRRAHELGCSLIEAHSHAGHEPAQFSASDKSGFAEFVPHVLWRLKGRPYAAIVMARASIDGLAWCEASRPLQVKAVVLGSGRDVTATGLTLPDYDAYRE